MKTYSGNLLVSDMKALVFSTFKDAITSCERELGGAKGIEATASSLDSSKSKLKDHFKLIFQKLDELDSAERNEIKDIAAELGDLSTEAGEHLADVLTNFCRYVYKLS